ncbi:alpha/beta fold hydrolase [Methylobacterium bullatum]|uniref:Aminoacrylate hydrolase RutD n=1 Tax=Methylobacterium bullatum TaxID=570505 RepID=A0AAV4Z9W1_9HYPH|nr:alpha/beta hydrolase [Methylobacterium bullatum]GJD40806.1 Putative aminoacrylate hydrolase RutD [Methylobacterium bullatum]
MPEVKKGGVKLVYEELGGGSKSAVLLVHGWGCNRSFMRHQQEFFGQKRRTIAVDLRGHGESDAPPEDYTVTNFANDLAWTCRNLEIERPIVVGHSMGGTVALEFGANYPYLVGAVVMIDSYVCLSPFFLQEMTKLSERLNRTDYIEAIDLSLQGLYLPGEDPGIREAFFASLRKTQQRVLSSAFDDHILHYNAEPAARRCAVPIAYIGAETSGANIDRLREVQPQIKVGQTMGSGHFSPLLVPDQINAMIRDFAHAYVTGG